MKSFLLYLLTGVLVGAIYALVKVRAPLPSMLVMVSFVGMFIGEQLPGFVQRYLPDTWATAPATATAQTTGAAPELQR